MLTNRRKISGVCVGAAGLLGALFLAGCAGSQGSRTAQNINPDKPIEAPSATLTVYGMACPLCANNVDKNLEALPGVSKVEIDMGNGLVKVDLNGPVRPTPKQLADTVERSGFTYKGITIP